jgi:hypothetical protein
VQGRTQTIPTVDQGVLETTMLDLVDRVGRVADDEETVVDAVIALLRTGRARLTGSFRDIPATALFPEPAGR